MARLVKNRQKWHKLTIKDNRGSDLILMGSGRCVQLSIWTKQENSAYFCGRKTLRKLAEEILKATAPRKRQEHNE